MSPTQASGAWQGNATAGDTLLKIALAAAEGFSSMSSAAGGGIERVGSALCWHSSSNIPVFNAAGLFSPDLITASSLDALRSYFQPRARSYALVVLDGLVPDATQLLVRMGYSQYDSMPAMWLDKLGSIETTDDRPDQSVQVKPAETGMERATFRSVLSQVFGMPTEEVEFILTDRAFRMPNMRHYIASTGAVVMGVASLVMGEEVAGIWNVGTLPQYRRRGIATKLLLRALAEAQAEGFRSSMLLATHEGTPLYERLGYNTVSTLRVFVPFSPSGITNYELRIT